MSPRTPQYSMLKKTAMRAGIFRTIVRNPTNVNFINIEYWGCGGDNDWKRNIFAYGFYNKTHDSIWLRTIVRQLSGYVLILGF